VIHVGMSVQNVLDRHFVLVGNRDDSVCIACRIDDQAGTAAVVSQKVSKNREISHFELFEKHSSPCSGSLGTSPNHSPGPSGEKGTDRDLFLFLSYSYLWAQFAKGAQGTFGFPGHANIPAMEYQLVASHGPTVLRDDLHQLEFDFVRIP
jgi:hypothetical protein